MADKIEDTKAFILASGLGLRLRPLTDTTNKGMLPVAGKPVFEHILESIVNAGIKEVVFGVGHLREQVMDYFGNGERFGVHIDYSVAESKEMPNTAGQISLAKPFLEGADDILVYYGDVMTNLDVAAFYKVHKESGKVITSPGTRQLKTESGVYIIDGSGTVIEFEEKPDIKKMAEKAFYSALRLYGKNIGSFENLAQDDATKPFCTDNAYVISREGDVYQIKVDELISLALLDRMRSNVPVYWATKEIWSSQGMAVGKDFNEHVFRHLAGQGKAAIFTQQDPELYHFDIGDLKKYEITCRAYETGTQVEIGKLA